MDKKAHFFAWKTIFSLEGQFAGCCWNKIIAVAEIKYSSYCCIKIILSKHWFHTSYAMFSNTLVSFFFLRPLPPYPSQESPFQHPTPPLSEVYSTVYSSMRNMNMKWFVLTIQLNIGCQNLPSWTKTISNFLFIIWEIFYQHFWRFLENTQTQFRG